MTDHAAMPDRGGIWPVPYEAHERRIIRTQAKRDRRSIPLLWLWSLLLPDDVPTASTPGGAAPHEVYWETPVVTRKYREPIAAHIYVDATGETKGRKKGTTETDGTIIIHQNRSEARRLGRIIGAYDDDENLVTAEDADAILRGERVPRPGELEPIYVFRPGDIFRYRDEYYQVNQMVRQWLGSTEILTHWEGTAFSLREDSTDPGMPQLIQPATFKPPLPREVTRWRG